MAARQTIAESRLSSHIASHGNLSPPSQVTFIRSVLLAVLALLVRYADAAVLVLSGHSFEMMLGRVLIKLSLPPNDESVLVAKVISSNY